MKKRRELTLTLELEDAGDEDTFAALEDEDLDAGSVRNTPLHDSIYASTSTIGAGGPVRAGNRELHREHGDVVGDAAHHLCCYCRCCFVCQW
jgi:hypothetical protein